MSDTFTAAERVRHSRWAGQVELTAEKLLNLLQNPPPVMRKVPEIDPMLIEALKALIGSNDAPVTKTKGRKALKPVAVHQFRVRRKTQREYMKEIATRNGGDRGATIEEYAMKDAAGEIPRRSKKISSYDYAVAMWADGISKGWL